MRYSRRPRGGCGSESDARPRGGCGSESDASCTRNDDLMSEPPQYKLEDYVAAGESLSKRYSRRPRSGCGSESDASCTRNDDLAILRAALAGLQKFTWAKLLEFDKDDSLVDLEVLLESCDVPQESDPRRYENASFSCQTERYNKADKTNQINVLYAYIDILKHES